MAKRFYVTTPIYYPSNILHLGHAYTTTIADILARYKKSQGYEVFFLTGSDEHGQKIAKSAAAKNLEPKAFVDQIVAEFKDLWAKLKIDYTHFIRTTDESHIITVQKIFSTLLKQGDIYLDKYQGWYCVSDEEFVTDLQIDKATNTCKNCGGKLIELAEESYFFKISAYSQKLLAYYQEHPTFIFPESRKNEMINNFIKPGLTDLSVTRTSFTWGVPVLENPKHVVYVWIDALSNYLSALGYLQIDDSNFQKFWVDEECEIVQLLGKEITRFHTIYWPILLMSLNLRQPNSILSHGWIINDEGKMSKSKGNIIDPRILIERYSADALRCFLIKEISFGSDGKYSHEGFLNFFNAYLVNDLGNLLSRILTMISKYSDSKIPKFENKEIKKYQSELIFDFQTTIKDFQITMDQYQVTDAVEVVWKLIAKLNKLIDDIKPWDLFKNQQTAELNNVLNLFANGLMIISILLAPILVDASSKMQEQLGVQPTSTLSPEFDLNSIAGSQVDKKELLFKRLDVQVELDYLNSK
ncbi:methionine--tRNA ligase [Spiroplasma platyhelix]|uniref:Methionine--tRNA ligase n=1 Tax=Spiroplasma platyhelix PALS-1 TaxID=1276218 RepID=A0A846TWI5_9MOLU|nr:methionine--tRNA ligase [Spiroplasma platyhelix]MBE4704169.1 Methionine--tRNA ligase [Spiroplasma platyhelix PALS-1]NKE38542.1 methionine--tRNA ligase [Spiroplasma platyhelix PALS-1]UJB29427.1 methionyl-tRNA synthetase [Spiroplasma platyhelix PALS-1]